MFQKQTTMDLEMFKKYMPVDAKQFKGLLCKYFFLSNFQRRNLKKNLSLKTIFLQLRKGAFVSLVVLSTFLYKIVAFCRYSCKLLHINVLDTVWVYIYKYCKILRFSI